VSSGLNPPTGSGASSGPTPATSSGRGRWTLRTLVGLTLLLLAVTAVVWGLGRWTADARRLHLVTPSGPSTAEGGVGRGRVLRDPSDSAPPEPRDPVRRVRVLAWNIAHGRGDLRRGWFKNWSGSDAERLARVERIAEAVRRTGADVVVLNEVDFDAGWSGGMNQAEIVAREAGYPYRVEQRNVDLQLPFVRFVFGNAVLSRLPITEARWMELPPHSRVEALLFGAKDGVVARIATGAEALSIVAVHLESRAAATRRAALPTIDSLRTREAAPLVLAGDFNAGLADDSATVVDRLVARGWRSPRATSSPPELRPTFPTVAPARALDWVLVEPPLRVVEARVVDGVPSLSDHAPVFSVVERPPPS